jgi:hypothetical protein
MIETLKVGNAYVGSVTKEKFTIVEIKKRYLYSKNEPHNPERCYYSEETEVKFLSSKSGEEIIASLHLVLWLIKSGGFITA